MYNVIGINLDTPKLTLIKGTSHIFTANVYPVDADNKNVFWNVTDPTVCTLVDGKVTALKEGTCIIIATTEDGGFKATCNITVTFSLLQNIKNTTVDVEGKDVTVNFDNGNFSESTVLVKGSNSNIETDNNSISFIADALNTDYSMSVFTRKGSYNSQEQVINFSTGEDVNIVPELPYGWNTNVSIDGLNVTVTFEKGMYTEDTEIDFSWIEGSQNGATKGNIFNFAIPDYEGGYSFKIRSKSKFGVCSEWSTSFACYSESEMTFCGIVPRLTPQEKVGRLALIYKAGMEPIFVRSTPNFSDDSNIIGVMEDRSIFFSNNINSTEASLDYGAPIYRMNMISQVTVSGRKAYITPACIDIYMGGALVENVYIPVDANYELSFVPPNPNTILPLWGDYEGLIFVAQHDLDPDFPNAWGGGKITNFTDYKKWQGNFCLLAIPFKKYLDVRGILSYDLMQGLKVRCATNLYDKAGNVITTLNEGDWIWFSNINALCDGGNVIDNPAQINIHSFSRAPNVKEVQANLIKTVSANGVNYYGINTRVTKFDHYFIDSYFNSGDYNSYAISIENYDSDIQDTGDSGYFGNNDDGKVALVWHGSRFRIRNTAKGFVTNGKHYPSIFEPSSESNDSNVFALLHQGYLCTSFDGSDKLGFVNEQCSWMKAPFITGFKDCPNTHVENKIYGISGHFDTQEYRDMAYMVGEVNLYQCSAAFNHENLGKHKIIDHSVLPVQRNVVPRCVNYTTTCIPFLNYIAKRIRMKCVDATDKPLDLISSVLSSFNSNFAIYNEPNDTYSDLGASHKMTLYGVRVIQANVEIGNFTDSNCTDFAAATQLQKDDWIWFSEYFTPKINKDNSLLMSVLGFSRGSDADGNPIISTLTIRPSWVNTGADKVRSLTADEEKILKIPSMIRDLLGIATPESVSARHYNIATIANKSFSDPTLLEESKLYGANIKNSMYLNTSGQDLQVITDNGTNKVIKNLALFTYISEYNYQNVKRTRVFFYDLEGSTYDYGYIDSPVATLFKYDLRKINTASVTIDNKTYCTLTLSCNTDLFNENGEFYGTLHSGDSVCVDTTIDYNNKSVGDVEPTRPNWIKIKYFMINKVDPFEATYEEFNGFANINMKLQSGGIKEANDGGATA